MIEKVEFEDTDNKVFITIDNETKDFEIKKIKKLPTYIDLEQPLNTALENNIELRASIYYMESKNKLEEDEINENDIKSKLNIDGTVTVTIYNGDNIYYSQNKKFIKGNIIDSIVNTLPLGYYNMTIEYGGNKYFEASTLSIDFQVEKRLATCLFKKDRYYGDFTETINIEGILKDKEKNIPINNCSLKYDFNGETYTTESDANGDFVISATIPQPDITHCQSFYEDININEPPFEPGDLYEEAYQEEFKDEDGNIRRYSDIEDINTLYDENNGNNPINIEEQDSENNIISIIDGSESIIEDIEDLTQQQKNIKKSYPNASYIINIYTDNDSYYLQNTQIEVVANKAPTLVTIESTNANTISNILTIHGSAIATYNNTDNDIKYGTINISLPDFNYNHVPVSIEEGNIFTTDIDLAQVYGILEASDTDTIEPYDTTSIINTSIKLSGDTNVNVGDMFTIEGKIVTMATNEYIKDGIMIFKLYDNDDNLLYQYATELDSTGTGIFHFNTSRKIVYQVQAQYIGIFGYQNSESEKIEVKVE